MFYIKHKVRKLEAYTKDYHKHTDIIVSDVYGGTACAQSLFEYPFCNAEVFFTCLQCKGTILHNDHVSSGIGIQRLLDFLVSPSCVCCERGAFFIFETTDNICFGYTECQSNYMFSVIRKYRSSAVKFVGFSTDSVDRARTFSNSVRNLFRDPGLLTIESKHNVIVKTKKSKKLIINSLKNFHYLSKTVFTDFSSLTIKRSKSDQYKDDVVEFLKSVTVAQKEMALADSEIVASLSSEDVALVEDIAKKGYIYSWCDGDNLRIDDNQGLVYNRADNVCGKFIPISDNLYNYLYSINFNVNCGYEDALKHASHSLSVKTRRSIRTYEPYYHKDQKCLYVKGYGEYVISLSRAWELVCVMRINLADRLEVDSGANGDVEDGDDSETIEPLVVKVNAPSVVRAPTQVSKFIDFVSEYLPINSDTATNDQLQAHKKVFEFLQDPEALFFRLTGGPGTGKTWLTSQFKMFLKSGNTMAAIAPTHKAVKVLSLKLNGDGSEDYRSARIPCSTVHSFLSLKPVYSGTDVEYVKDVKTTKDSKISIKLVVLDEGSQVGTKLFNYIKTDAELFLRKYIIVGDEYQLPPVGEEKSPLYTMDVGEYFYDLKEIVRQEAENPIALLTPYMRNCIDTNTRPLIETSLYKGRGIRVMGLKDWTKHLIKNVEAFDPDVFRVVAYKNNTVKKYNALIRELLDYDSTVPFSVGEWAVFNDAFLHVSDYHSPDINIGRNGEEPEGNFIQNGNEYQVLKCKPDYSVYGHKMWWITLAFNENVISFNKSSREYESDFVSNITVPMLHESAYEDYTLTKEKFIADARKDKSLWFKYYALRRFYADVRPIYSLTAHKSQGLTLDYVYTDMDDILSNSNTKESYQCLNVALTRPRYSAFVLQR